MVYSLALRKQQEFVNTLSRACSSQQPLQASDNWPFWRMRAGWQPASWKRSLVSLSPIRARRPRGMRRLRAAPHLQQHFSLSASWHGQPAIPQEPFLVLQIQEAFQARWCSPSSYYDPQSSVIFCQFCIHCCFQKLQFSVYKCFTMITHNNHWERQHYHVLISYELLAKAA